jgi:hypothetical protein
MSRTPSAFWEYFEGLKSDHGNSNISSSKYVIWKLPLQSLKSLEFRIHLQLYTTPTTKLTSFSEPQVRRRIWGKIDTRDMWYENAKKCGQVLVLFRLFFVVEKLLIFMIFLRTGSDQFTMNSVKFEISGARARLLSVCHLISRYYSPRNLLNFQHFLVSPADFGLLYRYTVCPRNAKLCCREISLNLWKLDTLDYSPNLLLNFQ